MMKSLLRFPISIDDVFRERPDFRSSTGWWLAFHGVAAVAWCRPPTWHILDASAGSACCMQLGLMRAMERPARSNGLNCIISDNRQYRVSQQFHQSRLPTLSAEHPLGWPQTLYWPKFIDQG